MQTDTDQLQGQQAGAQVSGGHLQPAGERDVLGAADQVQVVTNHLVSGQDQEIVGRVQGGWLPGQ